MDNVFIPAAEYHLDLARRAVKEGNSPVARKAYRIAVRAWRKAVGMHPSLVNYLIDAEKEYLEFLKADSVYPEILREIKMTIAEHPGMLQEELWTRLNKYHRADVKNVLHLGIKNGEIERRKKGPSVELRLPRRAGGRGIGSLFGRITGNFPFPTRRIERRLPSSLLV